MHPKQPQFADVANVSPSKCYDGPLLGRSSFLIKDDSSARHILPACVWPDLPPATEWGYGVEGGNANSHYSRTTGDKTNYI
ncbi:hypothetical protein CDAR_283521 [Caerostris darwini]|uniref:Uncharacterized protein n=1 Tax=Caerostris darwini TaxID=1538125 RepID=A0AAV4PEQ7_9ARAC|nr:hypothetical protein CDAR_283521 [Caerostris darwini]